MTNLTRILLTLRVDERATLLSELVDEDCRTAADFETVRIAFVKAALDRENEVPCIVANEPDLRDRLPTAYAISEIDPRPTTADLAEAAGRRLVDGLVHCAQEPLRSADVDSYGRLPAASRVASAQRLIALELMSVWALRADGVRAAVAAGIR